MRQLNKHEPELAELSKPDPGKPHRPCRETHRRRRERGEDALAKHESSEQEGRLERVAQEDPAVEHHSERDEEDAYEGAAKRDHVTHGAVLELGIGDDDAAEESAQGQRQAGQGRQPGRADADGQNGEYEHLAAALGVDPAQDAGNQDPGDEQDAHHHDCRLSQRQPDIAEHGAGGTRAAEHGNQEHHRNHAKILEDQGADDEPTVRGVRLAS